MSNKDMARRTLVQVAFQGVDITSDIRPYLLSLTFTDNEDGSADDLQIKLHDRPDIWMQQWLGDAVDAAASSSASSVSSNEVVSGNTGSTYKVTAKIGLNVRSGPGTTHSIYGALAYGTTVNVSSIENGWARINYSGKTAYVSATYIQPVAESTSSNGSSSANTTGFKIQAVIVRQNWNGNGDDKILDCGQFELDDVDVSGPPSTITLKATSLPYSTQIRQTKKSRVWENYRLSGIATEMADKNGMSCLFLSANDPFYRRTEQHDESDISFLAEKCRNAGISLKTSNNILILYDQVEYEAKDAILTIRKDSSEYLTYKLRIGTAGTKYASCRVSYAAPNGKCIEAIAYVEDYKEDSKNNQQLEINAKVSSIGEAKTLAEKMLRMHNKYERTSTFTMPGNPDIAAGTTVILEQWGPWSGKHIVTSAKHTVNNSGYTVQLTLRKVLEGY